MDIYISWFASHIHEHICARGVLVLVHPVGSAPAKPPRCWLGKRSVSSYLCLQQFPLILWVVDASIVRVNVQRGRRTASWMCVTATSWKQIPPVYSHAKMISAARRWERCRPTSREWCSASLICLHLKRRGNTTQQWCCIWADTVHSLHFLLHLR